MNTTVQSAIDNTHTLQEFKFRFKKDKLGNQRPTVVIQAPVPTADGIVKMLSEGDAKQFALVQEALYNTVRDVLGGFVSEDNFDATSFDISKLFWQNIANMPKEDRRSSTIPEELWTGFVADYCVVMPSVSGKTPEQVKNATDVYIKKMVPVKTNKKLTEKLKEQLALYSAQPSAEQFSDILELLIKRCDTYLAADDMKAILENL
jgi:predicted house-cleaning noncanonical NTP pyrophosphatase (MazG superfamily)